MRFLTWQTADNYWLKRLTPTTRFPAITRLNQQPIAQAELNHQNRSTPPPRRRWRQWLGRASLVMVYITAFILVGNEIIALLSMGSGRRVAFYTTVNPNWLIAAAVIAVGATVIIHFRRMLQTLSLSANSIARERGANNWDMLVLTGIDAGKIVRGKWWATIRHMWRPYVMLGILRAAAVVLYGASTYRSYYSYQFYNSDGLSSVTLIVVLLHFALAGTAVFIFTMANLFFTAACGVTAFNKRSGVALARAIGTRLFIIVGLGLLALLLTRLWINYATYPYLLPSIITISMLSLVDNGAILSSQFAYYSPYDYGPYLNPLFAMYLPAILVTLLLYLLLTLLLLRFARWQAVRNGAIPPLKRKLIQIV